MKGAISISSSLLLVPLLLLLQVNFMGAIDVLEVELEPVLHDREFELDHAEFKDDLHQSDLELAVLERVKRSTPKSPYASAGYGSYAGSYPSYAGSYPGYGMPEYAAPSYAAAPATYSYPAAAPAATYAYPAAAPAPAYTAPVSTYSYPVAAASPSYIPVPVPYYGGHDSKDDHYDDHYNDHHCDCEFEHLPPCDEHNDAKPPASPGGKDCECNQEHHPQGCQPKLCEEGIAPNALPLYVCLCLGINPEGNPPNCVKILKQGPPGPTTAGAGGANGANPGSHTTGKTDVLGLASLAGINSHADKQLGAALLDTEILNNEKNSALFLDALGMKGSKGLTKSGLLSKLSGGGLLGGLAKKRKRRALGLLGDLGAQNGGLLNVNLLDKITQSDSHQTAKQTLKGVNNLSAEQLTAISHLNDIQKLQLLKAIEKANKEQ